MKKVTISISNKELDALEDFCVAVITDAKREEECRNLSLGVWRKLVRAYDSHR